MFTSHKILTCCLLLHSLGPRLSHPYSSYDGSPKSLWLLKNVDSEGELSVGLSGSLELSLLDGQTHDSIQQSTRKLILTTLRFYKTGGREPSDSETSDYYAMVKTQEFSQDHNWIWKFWMLIGKIRFASVLWTFFMISKTPTCLSESWDSSTCNDFSFPLKSVLPFLCF